MDKIKKGKKRGNKLLEWYRVYETRLAINLLEPWEKCLANLMLVSIFITVLCGSLWAFKNLLSLV